jgi:hypothetical protein
LLRLNIPGPSGQRLRDLVEGIVATSPDPQRIERMLGALRAHESMTAPDEGRSDVRGS